MDTHKKISGQVGFGLFLFIILSLFIFLWFFVYPFYKAEQLNYCVAQVPFKCDRFEITADSSTFSYSANYILLKSEALRTVKIVPENKVLTPCTDAYLDAGMLQISERRQVKVYLACPRGKTEDYVTGSLSLQFNLTNCTTPISKF